MYLENDDEGFLAFSIFLNRTIRKSNEIKVCEMSTFQPSELTTTSKTQWWTVDSGGSGPFLSILKKIFHS